MVQDLLIANNLHKNAIIYVHQELRIPRPEEHQIQISTTTQPLIAEPLTIPEVPQPIIAAILPLSFGKTEASLQHSDILSTYSAYQNMEIPISPEINSGNLKVERVF
jgi:hypothetical protein